MTDKCLWSMKSWLNMIRVGNRRRVKWGSLLLIWVFHPILKVEQKEFWLFSFVKSQIIKIISLVCKFLFLTSAEENKRSAFLFCCEAAIHHNLIFSVSGLLLIYKPLIVNLMLFVYIWFLDVHFWLMSLKTDVAIYSMSSYNIKTSEYWKVFSQHDTLQ